MPAHEVRRAAALALALLAVACAPSHGDRPATSPATSSAEPTTPAQTESPIPHFASIHAAVAYIQARVDVPVVLPDPLPAGARLDPDHPVYLNDYDGRIGAQLILVDGEDGRIFLQYGVALFDGCGGDDAKPTQVLDQPAMYLTFPGPATIVLWPATPDNPEGRYGIQARGTLSEVRAMAESMERARAAASANTIGC